MVVTWWIVAFLCSGIAWYNQISDYINFTIHVLLLCNILQVYNIIYSMQMYIATLSLISIRNHIHGLVCVV